MVASRNAVHGDRRGKRSSASNTPISRVPAEWAIADADFWSPSHEAVRRVKLIFACLPP